MENRVKKQLVFSNVAVTTYFSTGLAISLIRESMTKFLQCVLLPVQGPDTVFTDPVRARPHGTAPSLDPPIKLIASQETLRWQQDVLRTIAGR
jgi:hypothetical protein